MGDQVIQMVVKRVVNRKPLVYVFPCKVTIIRNSFWSVCGFPLFFSPTPDLSIRLTKRAIRLQILFNHLTFQAIHLFFFSEVQQFMESVFGLCSTV